MFETFWLTANNRQRQVQYRVWKQLARTLGQTMPQSYSEALRQPPPSGSGYWDNVRAGRMDCDKCAELHTWMCANHPKFARRIERELGLVRDGEPPLAGAHSRHRVPHDFCTFCNPQLANGLSRFGFLQERGTFRAD